MIDTSYAVQILRNKKNKFWIMCASVWFFGKDFSAWPLCHFYQGIHSLDYSRFPQEYCFCLSDYFLTLTDFTGCHLITTNSDFQITSDFVGWNLHINSFETADITLYYFVSLLSCLDLSLRMRCSYPRVIDRPDNRVIL